MLKWSECVTYLFEMGVQEMFKNYLFGIICLYYIFTDTNLKCQLHYLSLYRGIGTWFVQPDSLGVGGKYYYVFSFTNDIITKALNKTIW